MQGELGLRLPQGPWIILVVTVACKRGKLFLSGISAQIILSTSSGVVSLSSDLKCIKR